MILLASSLEARLCVRTFEECWLVSTDGGKEELRYENKPTSLFYAITSNSVKTSVKLYINEDDTQCLAFSFLSYYLP